MDMRVRVIGAAVLAVVLFGGGFAAGRTIGTTVAASASPSGQGGRGQRAFGSGAPGAANGVINGQVLAVGDGTLTVQLDQSQGSRIVLVSASTRVTRTTETDVPLASLKPGEQVTVVGTQSSDGTVSATTVVVGATGFRQGGGSPRPSATP
ncbi:MAG: hypothetical protein AUH85_06955 [Chloroflexi bacterium 13_1_40CM_4_68_4]|nr:MAG: hypothetical protein AUH85_06955 [Chloroflexi bacterium 13_1_40CM_4_68_4]